MRGELCEYHGPKKLVAFRSAALFSGRAIVIVGGPEDGFLTLPWIYKFNSMADLKGYEVVHVLLSSTYSGFGLSSLNTDVEELATLLDDLQGKRIFELFLVGHSTGCQTILRFFQQKRERFTMRAVVLQGPISESDYFHINFPDFPADRVEEIKKLDPETILPFRVFGAPITAHRFLSLTEYGGNDDLFATRVKDKSKLLSELPVPCMVVMSGKDEYFPDWITPLELLKELRPSRSLYLPEAEHSISSWDADEFIEPVFKFIMSNTLIYQE